MRVAPNTQQATYSRRRRLLRADAVGAVSACAACGRAFGGDSTAFRLSGRTERACRSTCRERLRRPA